MKLTKRQAFEFRLAPYISAAASLALLVFAVLTLIDGDVAFAIGLFVLAAVVGYIAFSDVALRRWASRGDSGEGG